MNLLNKNVLIFGPPASGKTTFSLELHKVNPRHKLIHIDSYSKYGYQDSIYILISDLRKITGPTIVEGVQGYRLLRKGQQMGSYRPDLVIEVSVSSEAVERTYTNERDPNKLKYLKDFNRRQQNILMEYKAMCMGNLPEWINMKFM